MATSQTQKQIRSSDTKILTEEELKAKFAEIRKLVPAQLAEEIVSVQPMPANLDWNALEMAFQGLRNHRRSLGIHCCLDGDCETHGEKEKD